MHLLVLSDTHGDIAPVDKLLKIYHSSVQAVVHLGDHSTDIIRFTPRYTGLGLAFHSVTGNNEPFAEARQERVIIINGRKIFITHGHRYNVKLTTNRLVYRAQELEVDACLFGHTHVPVSFYMESIFFFNPGSLAYPSVGSRPSYGLIQVGDDGITGSHVEYIP